ncbi:type II toxin-antitoxin system RelE/ParE family toxin [Rhizobium sp. S152]|uniref:type II toxin-antitoxin system RelE/ParE family toxin n=1 Tax=Rhizobium sp. S152 TaxID=3055038 RepID=UPI0025A954EB|nr:type II toxin-antitoxin system RelE/ParE family toxin [Rhizobium sp. S152]MDM9627125.1 type II toxin-antitoxin system RelE/ParE family toxin [Rhizobium sp. S152]
MGGYQVDYLPSALDDLRKIFLYVLESSQSRLTAERYVDRIFDRCERIGDAPFAGVLRSDLGSDLRMAVFERSVLILYRVEAHSVAITNIFSGGRDYQALLRNAN